MLIASLFVALHVTFVHIAGTFNTGELLDLSVSICACDGTAAPTDGGSSLPNRFARPVCGWILEARCAGTHVTLQSLHLGHVTTLGKFGDIMHMLMVLAVF